MPPAFSADTSPAASAVQLSVWRAMTPSAKLAQVRELTTAVFWLEREGLRLRHPTFGPEALRHAAIERRLGPELAARAYPPAPRER